jgi:DNA-binding GntR family transcriptional regulator
MAVPFNTAMPIYHQIAQLLLTRARSGDFPASKLPSEKALCLEFGVSRTTIRQALDVLKRQNLLWSQRGVGTRFRLVPEDSEASILVGDPLSVALDTPIGLAQLDLVPAPGDAARFLAVAIGTPVCRLLRVHELAATPFSVAISYMKQELAAAFDGTSLKQPLGQFLWERLGLLQRRSAHTVRIVRADEHIAALLQVAFGDPVLNVQSEVFRDAGVPLRLTQNYFGEARYAYTSEVLWETLPRYPRENGDSRVALSRQYFADAHRVGSALGAALPARAAVER